MFKLDNMCMTLCDLYALVQSSYIKWRSRKTIGLQHYVGKTAVWRVV